MFFFLLAGIPGVFKQNFLQSERKSLLEDTKSYLKSTLVARCVQNLIRFEKRCRKNSCILETEVASWPNLKNMILY